MQHSGQILEKAIRKSNYPISKLAKRIGYTRQHMYNLFAQPDVDFELLYEIGKIINYDFSIEIKSLKRHSNYSDTLMEELQKNNAILENKYLILLEDYNNLLKEHQLLLKTKIKDYFSKH